MLPQSQALEAASADIPGVGRKRGAVNRLVTGRKTGVQHGRGEIPVGLTNQRERHYSPPGEEGWGLTALPSSTAARVFVVDRCGRPLMPCRPARARELLKSERARVHRLTPFVIRLVDRDARTSVVSGEER